jgi:hypothetical protein
MSIELMGAGTIQRCNVDPHGIRGVIASEKDQIIRRAHTHHPFLCAQQQHIRPPP